MTSHDGAGPNGIAGGPPGSSEDRPFIVGVGASAGGLEAVQEFLGGIPPVGGLAVVVVFHHDPAAKSVLPDVLAKHSRLPMCEPTDGQRVERDRVYTAPADRLLAVQGGCFRLARFESPTDRRTPIDHTLHSLAGDQKGWAAAVILSGVGSDGTLGLKAVSAAGGVTFVQEPATARFDGMPQSALATGAVDHLLPPDQLAAEVLATAAHTRLTTARTTDADLVRQAEDALPSVCDLLLKARGHNFRHYKTSTLVRRLVRRVQVLRLRTASEYVDRLRGSEAEAAQLFNDLLINVTAFFRDPEAFTVLTREVFPELFQREGGDRGVRMWCAGCATGEEAYTLGILVREFLDTLPEPRPQVQIFATDIDEEALAFARQGAYPVGIADQVGAERLKRFFVKKGQQYHVCKELRELVLFSAHNVINDPPFSRLDLISCRNLLIYLGSHLQKKLIPLFHYALWSGGYLFLGSSESLSSHRELFRPVDAKHRISQRLPTAIRTPSLLTGRSGPLTPVRPPNAAPTADPVAYLLMQRIILDEFAPKGVVVNEDGQIVSASGNLEKYLSVSAGAFHNSLTRLVRDGLRVGVRSALAEAAKVRRKVTHDGLSVRSDAGVQRVLVTVQPMPQMGEENGLFIVVFQDVGLPLGPDAPDRGVGPEDAATLIEQLERELTSTRDDLERTVQDLEAANEELKSGNEELLSMNEELQSTNEELETSKEEVQAANDALTRVNTDLENLLASTQIATLFLDANGHLRRVTPEAAGVYRVRPEDTNRPLADFTHLAANMPPLPDYAAVAAADRPIEHEVEMLDGSALLRRVMPYRNRDGLPEGVVVTFTDVTARKRAEQEERRRATELAAVLDAVPAAVWTTRDPDARDIRGNRTAAELLRLSDGANQSLTATGGEIPSHFQVFHAGRLLPPTDLPVQRAARGEEVAGYEEEVVFADGTRRVLFGNATPLRDADGRVYGAVAAFLDVTERKQAAEDQARLAAIVASSDDAIVSKTLDGVIRSWNAGAERIFGYTAAEIIGRSVTLLLPPDRLNEEEDILARVGRGERVVAFETVRVTKDGRRVDVSLTVSPLRDENGQIVGASKVARDVSERKRADAALRESEGRLRGIFDQTLVGFAETDLTGRFVRTNPRYRQIVGRTADELADLRMQHITHPDDLPGNLALVKRAVADVGSFVIEKRYVRPDGSVVWVNNSVSIVRDAQGAPRHMVAATLDITDRKRAEEALSRERERLAIALRAGGLGVYEWRVGAEEVWWSPEIYEVYGVDPAAFTPTVAAFDALVHPDDRAELWRKSEEATASCEVFAHEYRIVRPDGQIRWIANQSQVGVGADGRAERLSGVAWDVTARREADERVRSSEGLLRMITDAAPALISYIGPDHRYRLVNRAYQTWFARRREEVIDRPMREVLGEEAWATIAPLVERAFAGELVEYEAEVPYRVGGPRWIHASYTPDVGPDGAVRGVVALVTDISPAKRAETALRQSEERYRALTTASSDVVYRMSADWSELFPLDGGTLVASTAEPIRDWAERNIPADERPRVRAAIARATASGEMFELEHRVIRPDGGVGWTYSRAVPIRDAAGAVGEWFGTARDVTDQKRAEEAVRESEQRYRALFETMDQGFCVVEMGATADGRTDYRVVEMNPAFERHTGLSGVVGRSMRQAVPELEEFWFDTYGGVAATSQAVRFEQESAPMGRWFDVYAFRVGEATARRVAILFTDITARKRAEQERERLVGELREQDKRKNEFLATLAHELRNPLAPLRSGLAALKLGGAAAADPSAGQIERMDRQLSRLVHLVDDLLDMSRVTSGKITLKTERLDVREVVTATLEGCREMLDAAGHQFSTSTPAHPLPVEGDKTRLIQVLSNLLTNSAKYTPNGGRVTLTAERQAGQVVVRVTDTGVGIPADMLPKVFDLFTQVGHHLDRAQGGLGIGLSLVKRLVEMHAGTVTAESPGPGQGSTFTVRLPASEAPAESPRVQSVPPAPPASRSAHRVLVVDDNRDGAESLAMLLTLMGHTVRTAHDGPTGLSEARRFLPQVAFLDIGLPGMSGHEVARAFRADERLSGALLVAVTGWGSEDDKKRSRDAGFDYHLTKPAPMERVLEVLAAVR